MKYYLRHDYKPLDLQSLADDILSFWKSMTSDVYKQYIKQLHKVMPRSMGLLQVTKTCYKTCDFSFFLFYKQSNLQLWHA